MSEMFRMDSWDQLSAGIKKPLLISVVATGIITIITTIYYFFAPPVLPVFYSLARSEQSLAQKEWIFLFPVVGLLMSLLHSLLISICKEVDILILRLFAWTTVIMQFFLLLSLIRTIVITY